MGHTIPTSFYLVIMESCYALAALYTDFNKYGDVEEMVGNLQMAQLLSKLAKEQNRTIKIHLNLNAGGMSRNGFDMTVLKIQEEMLSLLKLNNIQITGIMTHFPNADAADLEATRISLEKFKEQANWIIDKGNIKRAKIILHVANTSARISSGYCAYWFVGSVRKIRKRSARRHSAVNVSLFKSRAN